MTQGAFDKKLLSELEAAGYSTQTLPNGRVSIGLVKQGKGKTPSFEFTFSPPAKKTASYVDIEGAKALAARIREQLSEEDKTAFLQVKVLPNGTIIIDQAAENEDAKS